MDSSLIDVQPEPNPDNYRDITDLPNSIGPTLPVTALYHAQCQDGFGAAYSVWKLFGSRAQYCACEYAAGLSSVPRVDHHLVFVLDFAFDAQDMLVLLEQAEHVVWLDHHPKASQVLAELKATGSPLLSKMTAVIDSTRSGAELAWDFVHPTSSVPPLIAYIGDYDRWQFKLKDTRASVAALGSHEYDFLVWDHMMDASRDPEEWKIHVGKGVALIRHSRQIARELAHHQRSFVYLGKTKVPCVPAPRSLCSSVCEVLFGQGYGIVAVYQDLDNGTRKWSVRSRGDLIDLGSQHVDVNTYCQTMGGGGHANAAGFSTKNPGLLGGYVKLERLP